MCGVVCGVICYVRIGVYFVICCAVLCCVVLCVRCCVHVVQWASIVICDGKSRKMQNFNKSLQTKEETKERGTKVEGDSKQNLKKFSGESKG